MAREKYDLLVVGGGPGGYTAAIRAAQLGWRVACVEKKRALGGTCLRVGCIPSKALLESSELYREAREKLDAHGVRLDSVELDLETMMKRKEEMVDALARNVAGLLEQKKVRRYLGQGRIAARGRVVVEADDGATELEARHILIATGSTVASLPGVEVDGDLVTTSTEALSYSEVPKHLVVIGAGAVGLELGSVWRRLGSEVTVLDHLDRILPGMDIDVARAAQKVFEKQGLDFKLNCRVRGTRRGDDDRCVVECECEDPIHADRVLVSVGRVPYTDGLGLEGLGVEKDDRGRIVVDENFSSSVDGIHAIGDVIRGPMLAHKAEEEGIACVERLVTGHGEVNYSAIPSVVYTQPEVASVGSSEEELESDGIEYRKSRFPFRANARAHILGHVEGFVKILADRKTDRILGAHILGPRAGDLIAEAVVAIEFGASSEDLARIAHAHPTLAEAVREAALAVDERALHR